MLLCLDFLTSAPVSLRGHGAVQAFSTGTLGPGWDILVLIVEVWKSSRVLEDSQDTPELGLLRQALHHSGCQGGCSDVGPPWLVPFAVKLFMIHELP